MHKYLLAATIIGIFGGLLAATQYAQSRTVSGMVLDSATSQSLPGARMEFIYLEGDQERSVRGSVDASGQFSVTPPVEAGIVAISSPGYAPTRRRWPSTRESYLMIALDREVPLTGAIRDASTGVPIPGAVTVAVGRKKNPTMSTHRTSTGEFALKAIPPGEAIVWARARGMAPTLTRMMLRSGQSRELEFHLRRAAVVTGIVVDSNGQLARGANVRFEYEDISLQPLQAFVGGRLQTREDGRFLLNGLIPETALTIRAELDAVTSAPLRLTLAEGQEMNSVKLQIP